MFKSIKLHTGGAIDFEYVLANLVEFGYKKQEACSEEGDFSRRGGIIDIFPFTFELPIRIDTSPSLECHGERGRTIDTSPSLEYHGVLRQAGDASMDKIASIKTFDPSTGKSLWEHSMVIILPIKKTRSFKTIAFKEEFPVENFVDLNVGDYVVHTQHGIGRFLGLEKIKIKDKHKDHLVIEYDRQEKLYVPVDSMHLVQKYIAFQVRRPKLYRLGTKEWQRRKERAKKGIQKLAWEILSLQAMRMSVSGFAYSPDTDWQKQFEATFPYKETPGQIKATLEVKQDMESSKPMDRLLCGDVGYGKTEVAMRAAFKAVQDFKQVAYLVPTTILAKQHYYNFSERLKDFPINISMLSRFKTGREQKEIIEGLSKGTVDIVIGTHRLLSDDIKFKDLGMIIIDEEQRFGVRAKEKLKSLRLTTEVLILTATPIPRTLYMSLMGAKDFSIINTPPQNRLPIKTVMVEYDEELVYQAVTRELARNGQVYFVHNRIQDIEKVKDKIAKILPSQIKLAIAHGQMHSRVLEKVMVDFLKAKIDILVCTMIIESGIDIPNVNTIIVNNAHGFGLSDLHQLRGRVGRFDKPAYAYFMVPKAELLDTEAKKRLQAIQEHWDLGSGFRIAMEDLEIRGAGNLLGVQQHGFIAAVGFDLYCRLLREAVSTFKRVMTNDKILPTKYGSR